jgi:hypothetical protein
MYHPVVIFTIITVRNVTSDILDASTGYTQSALLTCTYGTGLCKGRFYLYGEMFTRGRFARGTAENLVACGCMQLIYTRIIMNSRFQLLPSALHVPPLTAVSISVWILKVSPTTSNSTS